MNNEATRIEKTRAVAAMFFPDEEWIQIDERIFAAKSRHRRTAVFAKELIQARILSERGSIVYFLPETTAQNGRKTADAVVDGLVMEFKTITGGLKKVEKRFRYSRKQGKNVFLKIDSPELNAENVLKKIENVLCDNDYTGGIDGMLIVHITRTGETFFWDLAEIAKNSPPP